MKPDTRRRDRALRTLVALAVIALLAWLLLRDAEHPRRAPPPPPPTPPSRGAERPVAPTPAEPATAPVVEAEPAEPEPVSPYPPADGPGLPLRVLLIDGTTGAPVLGAELVLLDREKKGGRYPLQAVGDGYEVDPSPLRPGRELAYSVESRLPEGFLKTSSPHLYIGGTSVAEAARRVEARLLVWPEARVRVRVEEADGRPVAGALVRAVRSGHLELRTEDAAPTDGRGETVITGVPAIPGERVVASASAETRWAQSEPATMGRPIEETLVRIVLPAAMPKEEEFALPTGFGDASEWSIQTPQAEPGPDERRRTPREPPASGDLAVRVLRRDGSPASGIRVRAAHKYGMTDAAGVARFPGVRAEPHWAGSGVVGFYLQSQIVEVVAGTETTIELREPGTVDGEVLVLDEEGRPVSGASLTVIAGEGAWQWVCAMQGETQLVGLLTGPDGLRRLEGLPALRIGVTAQIGSRSAHGQFEGGGRLEIRLPPPK